MPIAAAVAVCKNIAKPIRKTIRMGGAVTITGAGGDAVLHAGEATKQQAFLLALFAVRGKLVLCVVRKVLHKAVNPS